MDSAGRRRDCNWLALLCLKAIFGASSADCGVMKPSLASSIAGRRVAARCGHPLHLQEYPNLRSPVRSLGGTFFRALQDLQRSHALLSASAPSIESERVEARRIASDPRSLTLPRWRHLPWDDLFDGGLEWWPTGRAHQQGRLHGMKEHRAERNLFRRENLHKTGLGFRLCFRLGHLGRTGSPQTKQQCGCDGCSFHNNSPQLRLIDDNTLPMLLRNAELRPKSNPRSNLQSTSQVFLDSRGSPPMTPCRQCMRKLSFAYVASLNSHFCLMGCRTWRPRTTLSKPPRLLE